MLDIQNRKEIKYIIYSSVQYNEMENIGMKYTRVSMHNLTEFLNMCEVMLVRENHDELSRKGDVKMGEGSKRNFESNTDRVTMQVRLLHNSL